MSQELTTTEIDPYVLDPKTIEEKLQATFNGAYIDLLQKLVHHVAVAGLTEKEACTLQDYDYTSFLAAKQRNPLIQQLFDRKQLEYKRDLLEPLSKRARTDDKLAQWLLENRFPEDFNKRKGAAPDAANEDMLGEAIKFIQQNSQSSAGIVQTQTLTVTKKQLLPTLESTSPSVIEAKFKKKLDHIKHNDN